MKIKRKKNEMHIPILRGTLNKKGNLILCFCPFCDRSHLHGYERGDGLTHRVAHCWNNLSPYNDTGYFIAPLRKKDLPQT